MRLRQLVLLLTTVGAAWITVALAGEKAPKPPEQTTGPTKSSTRDAVAPRKKAPTASAEDKELSSRPPSIRVDTNLVLINVTVTDPLNRFVTGLEAEHFKLLEDKTEQKIATFASEDAPLSVGLVFDASGSMGSKLQKARLATAQFFKTANPEDEFYLVQFNDRPELTQPFTTNTEEIQNRLTFTQAKGRTALLEIMGSNLRTKESVQIGESEGKTFYEIIEASRPFGWWLRSQIRSRGRATMARAIAARWHCPPLNSCG